MYNNVASILDPFMHSLLAQTEMKWSKYQSGAQRPGLVAAASSAADVTIAVFASDGYCYL